MTVIGDKFASPKSSNCHQYNASPTIHNIFISVQKLLGKVDHYKIFWDNAETNCRLEKKPLPGDPDDGSFTGFEYSLSALKRT